MTTFVMIPGLVSDARVWRHLSRALCEYGVAYNADVTRDDSIEAMAARLLDKVEGPLIAAGHSMGGRVAMEIAHQAPERVRGLILANTGHAPSSPAELPKRQAKIDLGHRDMARLAREWLPPMLAPARTGDAGLVADLTEMVLTAGPDVHERQIRALIGRPDASAYLTALGMPILLLTGAQDGWSPEAQHREIAALAADAEVQVIAGAGHFLPVERPEALTAAVIDWLVRRSLIAGPATIAHA